MEFGIFIRGIASLNDRKAYFVYRMDAQPTYREYRKFIVKLNKDFKYRMMLHFFGMEYYRELIKKGEQYEQRPV